MRVLLRSGSEACAKLVGKLRSSEKRMGVIVYLCIRASILARASFQL